MATGGHSPPLSSVTLGHHTNNRSELGLEIQQQPWAWAGRERHPIGLFRARISLPKGDATVCAVEYILPSRTVTFTKNGSELPMFTVNDNALDRILDTQLNLERVPASAARRAQP